MVIAVTGIPIINGTDISYAEGKTVSSYGAAQGEDGTYWTWDAKTATLTISYRSNSRMKDYKIGEKRPWESYINSIKTIRINEGVTYIGQNAFSGCTSLSAVNINGKTLEGIGSRAFYECRNLNSIETPASLKSIGYYAFFDCTSLKSVTFCSNQLKELKNYAFGNCSSLTNLRLAEGLVKIGDYCFSACNNLKQVSFPSTLEQIGNCAFSECKVLQKADFEDTKLKSIGIYAFNGCISLKYCIIPKSTTSIGDYAFQGSPSIEYLKILSWNTSFGDDICKNCGSKEISIFAYPNNTNVSNYVNQYSSMGMKYLNYFNTDNMKVTLERSSYTYDGKPKNPKVTVKYIDGTVLRENIDYELKYLNNINVGQAQVIVRGMEKYDGRCTFTYQIVQASQELKLEQNKTSYSIIKGKKIKISATSTGNEGVSYSTSNAKVATVDANGNVNAVGCGKAQITISANKPQSSNYKPTQKQVQICVGLKQNIKTSKKSYNRTYGSKAFSLGTKVSGKAKVSYSSSNKKVVTVDKKGKVSIKGAGIAEITIKSKPTNQYFSAVKKVKVTIKPRKVKVSGKASGKKGAFVLQFKNLTPNTTLVIKQKVSSGKKESVTKIKVGKKRSIKDEYILLKGRKYKFIITAEYTDKKHKKTLKSSKTEISVKEKGK